jgi:hypothetical protein
MSRFLTLFIAIILSACGGAPSRPSASNRVVALVIAGGTVDGQEAPFGVDGIGITSNFNAAQSIACSNCHAGLWSCVDSGWCQEIVGGYYAVSEEAWPFFGAPIGHVGCG